MASIFSRLYVYRERPSVSPLENFLTEAFAEMFGRLPLALKRSLVMRLLPPGAQPAFDRVFPNLPRLTIRTQAHASAVSGSSKRPDLIVQVDDRDIIVIEVKVGGALQQHASNKPDGDVSRRIVQNQLETYAEWIAGVNARGDAWHGAIVFLTTFTQAPNDFIDGRADRVFRSTRSWKDVGDWIVDEVAIGEHGVTHCAIAAELYRFLKERNLMNKYMTANDISAATLYVRSNSVLYDTFFEVLKHIGGHASKLRGSRRYNVDFWSEACIYWAWFHFAESVKRRTSKPYVAIGICFEISEFHVADSAKLPKHEPFFFLACADEWDAEKPTTFLTALPEGWVDIQDEWMIAVTKPVRGFSSDPDERVEELKAWARLEIDKLLPCVPGYSEAPTEAPPTAEESEKE